MSATTPGMRHIWMDTVVRCVDQRMADVSDDRGVIARASSVSDDAELRSDFACQNAASLTGEVAVNLQAAHKTDAVTVKHCHGVSDKVEPGLSSVVRFPSSVRASTSDSVLHTESHSTDVCCFISVSLSLYTCFLSF